MTDHQQAHHSVEYIRGRLQYIVEQKLPASQLILDQVLQSRFPHLQQQQVAPPSSSDDDKKSSVVDLNRYIDHTLLKPNATGNDIRALCNEAIKFSFAAVCVNGCRLQLAKSLLRDNSQSPVGVACVVGFPLGAMTQESKLAEARDALDKGATELDVVMNVGQFLDEDYEEVYGEIEALAHICHARSPPAKLKVILETCLLDKDSTIDACIVSVLAGVDYVKTSTGFSTGGATLDTVRLMKQTVGSSAKVKASGGIRNAEDARAYVLAGADRIGTSSGVAICGSASASKSSDQPSTY